MRRVVVPASLLFVALIGGVARADLAPPDSCSSPGQPCQNAGASNDQAGTCTATTCTKRVQPVDGGSETMAYACNLCQAPPSDAGNNATGGVTGTGTSGTGGAAGSAGVSACPACKSTSGCAVAGPGADLGGVALLVVSLLALAFRRRRGFRSSLWLAVPFVFLAAGAARADVAPDGPCSSLGQPCNNAGVTENQPGTCTTTTCYRNVLNSDGGRTSMPYSCMLCLATSDGGRTDAASTTGAAGSSGAGGSTSTGGTPGSAGSTSTGGTPGSGGSAATGGVTGSGGSTKSGGSSGCAVATGQAGDAGGSAAVALVAVGLALAIRRRHARA